MSFSTENPMQAFAASMTPKFAVSYLRVSTRGQAERGGGADEGFSIPAQREANKNKALSMGAMIGKEFVDRGASAKSADRPELQKMQEYVKENADRVDYVIVHKVDRLARNRGDDIDIMRVLRECGVQLVSASESIDDTPAGMLLHGIMSSIAEFYSQNLANEVRKGITEKVKSGGTVSRASLGYLNIRRIDEKGREERTLVLDKERAPLVKMAFEEYATGNWTVEDLAEHLAMCGLTTRPTPKIPSVPINQKALYKILVNLYYKGVVKYKGVEYAGSHPALVDETTWQQVQNILASHVNGERTREHPHILKGSLYCHSCGSRMIINYTKSRSGVRYPYFVCAGRHNKVKNCKLKAVLIGEVERQVEQIYDRYSFPPAVRKYLENFLQEGIKAERQKYEAELDGLRRERDKLERQRKKLLEAHYNDAIPLDFLKEEQQKIAKQLAAIENEVKARECAFESISERLSEALELMEDCGKTYRQVSDHVKKLLNQAIFSKLWVETDGRITAEFTKPFDTLAAPLLDVLTRYKQEDVRGTNVLTDIFFRFFNRLQKFFGDGWSNDLLVGPNQR
nr:recombinase family protein [uncultured Oscillibacter sp.]